MGLYMVFLFVVLSPGILLTLPPKGSKLVVATVHGLVFALVYCLTYNTVWLATSEVSGFAVKDPKNCKTYTEFYKNAVDRASREKNPLFAMQAKSKVVGLKRMMDNYCSQI